ILVLLLIVTNLITAFTILRIGPDDLTQRAKIAWVKNYIDRNYLREVDEEDYKLGELKGIVASLNDPYSEYYSEEELKELLEFTSGVFYGIGIQVAPGEDNRITVISPIKGSPAEEAGIQAGDKIVAVDGREYMASQMEEAVSTMRGGKGVKGLILDLRGNPGGVLDSAVEVSDALLPKGKIVYAKNKEGKEVLSYDSDPQSTELPLVILINKGSASASEVVSGAIKDNN